MSSPTVAELPKIPSDLAQGVIGKVDLKKVDTVEKNVLPTKEDVQQERQHVEMLSGIENFSSDQLKHATTQEKTVLPSPADIKQEKVHQELTNNIESFSPEKLRHAETEEKIVLPSKEDIAREKVVEHAANFDKNQLRHVEPTIKTNVEDPAPLPDKTSDFGAKENILMEKSVIRGFPSRRKRNESTHEEKNVVVEETSDATPQQTPKKRGRKPKPRPSIDEVKQEEVLSSPRKGRKRNEIKEDEDSLRSSPVKNIQFETTDDESDVVETWKRKGGRRYRQSSRTDINNMDVGRSSRQRQPSRKLIESKESQEMVKIQLAPRMRHSSQNSQRQTDSEANLLEEKDLQSEPTEEVEKNPELPVPGPKKRGRKKKIVGDPLKDKSPTPEQPKITFKTVNTHPPREPPAKKPFAPSSTLASSSTISRPVTTGKPSPSKVLVSSTQTATPNAPKMTLPVRYIEKGAESSKIPLPVHSASSSSFERPPGTSESHRAGRFHRSEHPRPRLPPPRDINQEDNMYAYNPNDVVNEEVVVDDGLEYVVSPSMNEKLKRETVHAEEDDDVPPRLQAEKPTHEEFARNQVFVEQDAMIRVQTTEGETQYVSVARGEDGTEVYLDENGDEVHMVDEVPITDDPRTVEFNFLDSKNICCGLCGEIVPYDNLMSHHLPQNHPEIMGDGFADEESYGNWLRDKLYMDKKNMEGGFRYDGGPMGNDDFYAAMRVRGARPLRKVSQIRVNPIEMDMDQLDHALKRKMQEKMGRKVPVSLVDKQHAKCGICQAVVSLNKKFEIVHLVRHFNAWHPSLHRCAGTWQNKPATAGCGKPLSIQDFAVIDVNTEHPDNLQCIWCGMFMDQNALAMHFTEVHPDEVEVPKCLLCLQELVINARLLEKYGDDFEVTLPDEHHVRCQKFGQVYTSEAALDKAISKRVQKINAATNNETPADEDDDEEEGATSGILTNSRMQFGRRNKPKRSFVKPSLRQAVPVNSKYVEEKTVSHWICKLCRGNIFGAVISAGAIKHYKQYHPGEMENMQYELCKARLDHVSGGCMEFVHPQLVECLICNLTYALHKPYNMCRGIRHLKLKHPDMMPENSKGVRKNFQSAKSKVRIGEIIDDPEMIARFKNEYHVDFDKVQAVYGEDGEPVYVLLGADEVLDARTAAQMLQSLGEGGPDQTNKRVVVGPKASMNATAYDDEDPYGELAEEDELAALERKPEVGQIRIMDDQIEDVVEEQFIDVRAMEPKREIVESAVIQEEQVNYQDEDVVEEEYEYYDQVEYIEEGDVHYIQSEEYLEGDEAYPPDQEQHPD